MERHCKQLGCGFRPQHTDIVHHFHNTMERAAHNLWSRTTAKIRVQVQQLYGRKVSLVQRIKYVHSTFLNPIWYPAQTLPPPETYTRQLTTAISLYLWRGATLRVTLSTLQKSTKQEGWNLLNVAVKCQALFLRSRWLQSQKEGIATAYWLRSWRIMGRHHHPSYLTHTGTAGLPPPVRVRHGIYRTIHPNRSPPGLSRNAYTTQYSCWRWPANHTPSDAHCPEKTGRTLGHDVAQPSPFARPGGSSVSMVCRNS